MLIHGGHASETLLFKKIRKVCSKKNTGMFDDEDPDISAFVYEFLSFILLSGSTHLLCTELILKKKPEDAATYTTTAESKKKSMRLSRSMTTSKRLLSSLGVGSRASQARASGAGGVKILNDLMKGGCHIQMNLPKASSSSSTIPELSPQSSPVQVAHHLLPGFIEPCVQVGDGSRVGEQTPMLEHVAGALKEMSAKKLANAARQLQVAEDIRRERGWCPLRHLDLQGIAVTEKQMAKKRKATPWRFHEAGSHKKDALCDDDFGTLDAQSEEDIFQCLRLLGLSGTTFESLSSISIDKVCCPVMFKHLCGEMARMAATAAVPSTCHSMNSRHQWRITEGLNLRYVSPGKEFEAFGLPPPMHRSGKEALAEAVAGCLFEGEEPEYLLRSKPPALLDYPAQAERRYCPLEHGGSTGHTVYADYKPLKWGFQTESEVLQGYLNGEISKDAYFLRPDAASESDGEEAAHTGAKTRMARFAQLMRSWPRNRIDGLSVVFSPESRHEHVVGPEVHAALQTGFPRHLRWFSVKNASAGMLKAIFECEGWTRQTHLRELDLDSCTLRLPPSSKTGSTSSDHGLSDTTTTTLPPMTAAQMAPGMSYLDVSVLPLMNLPNVAGALAKNEKEAMGNAADLVSKGVIRVSEQSRSGRASGSSEEREEVKAPFEAMSVRNCGLTVHDTYVLLAMLPMSLRYLDMRGDAFGHAAHVDGANPTTPRGGAGGPEANEEKEIANNMRIRELVTKWLRSRRHLDLQKMGTYNAERDLDDDSTNAAILGLLKNAGWPLQIVSRNDLHRQHIAGDHHLSSSFAAQAEKTAASLRAGEGSKVNTDKTGVADASHRLPWAFDTKFILQTGDASVPTTGAFDGLKKMYTSVSGELAARTHHHLNSAAYVLPDDMENAVNIGETDEKGVEQFLSERAARDCAQAKISGDEKWNNENAWTHGEADVVEWVKLGHLLDSEAVMQEYEEAFDPLAHDSIMFRRSATTSFLGPFKVVVDLRGRQLVREGWTASEDESKKREEEEKKHEELKQELKTAAITPRGFKLFTRGTQAIKWHGHYDLHNSFRCEGDYFCMLVDPHREDTKMVAHGLRNASSEEELVSMPLPPAEAAIQKTDRCIVRLVPWKSNSHLTYKWKQPIWYPPLAAGGGSTANISGSELSNGHEYDGHGFTTAQPFVFWTT